MKYYHLILLVCLVTGIGGCSKRDDATPFPQANNAGGTPESTNIKAWTNYSMHNVSGKYLVSGSQYDESMGQTTAYNNDTIVITQCGDSSVYLNGSGWLSNCCTYTIPNTNLNWGYTENYLYTYSTSKIKIGIFFPADQPGSITITGSYNSCGDWGNLSLTGVRIQ